MWSEQISLLPSVQKFLTQFGEDIKLARLRRELSTTQVAERVGISRSTLWQIAKGAASVAMGAYLQVLFVLGLAQHILTVAANHVLGHKLQDAGLLVKKRAPKRPVKLIPRQSVNVQFMLMLTGRDC